MPKNVSKFRETIVLVIQWSSNFSAHQNYLGELAGSHFSRSVMGPDICNSNKFPHAADSAGCGHLIILN